MRLSFLIVLTFSVLNAFSQKVIHTLNDAHGGNVNALATSPDGERFITGGSDKRTNLWDLSGGRKLKAFGGHTDKVTAVAFSSDARFFVTGSADMRVIIWDAVTHKPKKILKDHSGTVTCLAVNSANQQIASGSEDQSIVIFSSSGRELTTLRGHSGALRAVAFSDNGKKMASAAADNTIIIWDVSTGNKLKTIKADANDIAFKGSDELAVAAKDAQLYLLNVNTGATIDKASGRNSFTGVTVSPDAKYVAGAQGNAILLWNLQTGKKENISAQADVLAFNPTGNFLVSSAGSGATIWDVRELGIKGRPAVVAEAEQATAQVQTTTSEYRGVVNERSYDQEIRIGKYYALIIGADDYAGAWMPLSNAVNDAKAVERLLRDNYRFDHFKTLYNSEATRINIIKELEWLVENVKPNDNVLIYYSGHGDFKKSLNKGYWVPIDARTTSVSSYISNSVLQDFLNGISSQHTLLLSDACFSGDIFRGSIETIPFEASEKYFNKVYALKSRQAISSGGIEPVMDGGREGHSVFAYYLLQALQKNSSTYMDASQLYTDLRIPVVNNSEQSPIFSPIKNTGDEGGQFIFIKK